MNPHEVNQLARDTAAVVNVYVGPDGEIVVDTDAWTIRLQDNSTPGGHIFAPLEITDTRYQALNSFLTSLIGLKDQPGFVYVTATGLGTRALSFSNQFTIDNQVLATDDFRVELKTTQVGAWTFGSVTADTFTGDLIGDSTGNHTGDVTGDLTGDSNGSHTGPSAGVHTGALDVRGESLLLDDNQILDAALSDEAQAAIAARNRVPPQWSIMMWDSARAIPAGWQECDGTNGTIDMRGRFPVGASSADADFNAGVTGGSKSHTHGTVTSTAAGSHDHAITVAGTSLTIAQMPAHSHSWTLGNSDGNAGLSANGSVAGPPASSNSQGNGDPHSHTATSDTESAHSHDTTIPSLQALPPYRAIFFIQRIAA